MLFFTYHNILIIQLLMNLTFFFISFGIDLGQGVSKTYFVWFFAYFFKNFH